MPNTSYTYWYVLQYIPVCIGMYYVGIWYVWNNDTCQYWPNTCLFFNTCQYWRQHIPKLNTRHYMPNTYQYIPIHTTICQIHTKTTSRLVQHTGFRPAYKYWHVSWYVLVCIMQVFGVYYVMILVKLAILTIFPIHTNTSEYVQKHAIHTIHTNAYQYRSVLTIWVSNTYKYRQILTNTYQYLQYISLLINTDQYTSTYHTSNTDQYIQIHIITYTMYNTYKSFPIQASTLKYIHIQTNTDKYLPIRAIHFITYQFLQMQASTYHTYQFRPIHSIQANIDGYVSIQFNTYQYVHYIPFFHACQY